MRRLAVFGMVTVANLVALIMPVAAETFVLANGEVIEGTTVRSLGGTLTIRLDNTGMRQIPMSDIQRVEIPTEEGSQISGVITRWSQGFYHLTTEQGELHVKVEAGQATGIDRGGGNPAVATVTPEVEKAADLDSIRAGFVYPGPIEDAGWTYQHDQGRRALAQKASVTDTTVVTLEVEEDDRVRRGIDQLVADGSNVVFMATHESADAMAKAAARHGDITFIGCAAVQPRSNIGIYCGRIYQARYLSGIVAGGMTRSNVIGYVAAKPTSDVIRGINAFALGAQSVNPDVKVVVDWTGAWYAPGVAREKAADLLDDGADILSIHQDSPAALQVAEQRGKMAIGYQSDMAAFAPSAMLTSAVWNWGIMYRQVVDRLQQGGPQPDPRWIGLSDGVVDLTALSSRVPAALATLVEQRRRELIEGRRKVFTGPIRDSDGDMRVTPGRTMPDERLLTMDFLVEGVTGAFDSDQSASRSDN